MGLSGPCIAEIKDACSMFNENITHALTDFSFYQPTKLKENWFGFKQTDVMKAKVGTARLFRQKCLAWELEKKCLICDEVCPFDAIEFRKLPDKRIAVPFVIENKCAGCGFCEHYCPVRATPAIVVEPMLALRLFDGAYRAAARERGYTLELGKKSGGTPLGYSDPGKTHTSSLDGNELPPGFMEQ